MTILFQLFDGENWYDLGKVEDGEVIEEMEGDFEAWLQWELSHSTTPDIDDEKGLLRTYDGPHIIAKVVGQE